jgi:hypothetical protein
MEDKYFTKRQQELDQMAQRTKDDYIDEILRLTNLFNRDWQELIAKKNQLVADQQLDDKEHKI